MKGNKILLAAILIFTSYFTYGQGYEIKIKFPQIKNDTVILGHRFSAKLIPDDTIVTNNKGEGVFKGKKMKPSGMFFVFFKGGKYFDILLDKDQEFEIIGTDTTDFIGKITFNGSKENEVFINYQVQMNKFHRETQKLKEERDKYKGNKSKLAEIDKKIGENNEGLMNLYKKTITENPDLFFSTFLKATRDVEVPKTITDRRLQYEYFKKHYFDNFDFSDPRLLRTPIYEGKFDTYVDKLIIKHPDSTIKDVDIIIDKVKAKFDKDKDKYMELYRFVLVKLFTKYQSSQVITDENVFVHIADKYYIHNPWSEKKYIKELIDELGKKKRCTIGNKAYNISMRRLDNDTVLIDKAIENSKNLETRGLEIIGSQEKDNVKHNEKIKALQNYFNSFGTPLELSDVNPEYTIIWFWTPDCSHCKKDTPKFYEAYNEKKLKSKGVEVVSCFMNKTEWAKDYSIPDDPNDKHPKSTPTKDWKKFVKITKEWMEFIKKHKMYNWINTWAPFDPYRYNYDITSSPVVYLLDKNKVIIAKRIGYEQAIEIIEKELEMKSKNNK